MVNCFLFGLSSSLDTLMSQEYGAANYDNCAMYFNKTQFLNILITVAFFPLFFFSADVLSFLGVDPVVAQHCQNYLLIYYWATVLWIQCNIMKLYLRVQRIVWPSLVGSLVCLVAYIVCIETLRRLFGTSYYAIAIANTVAFLLELAFLIGAIRCGLGDPRTRRCLRKSDLSHWRDYCRIAIPAVLV